MTAPAAWGARAWRLALALLALAAIGPHLGVLGNEHTFDDHLAIEQSPLTEHPFDVAAHLRSGFWGQEQERVNAAWRPLTTLTFAWNRAAGGLAPSGYHLVNLLLHAAATLLVAAWARRLGAGAPAALAAGLLFAVHPVHVEAIAAGVGRADLLAAVAGLAALLAYERGRLGLALAALAAALLAKEIAVTLPVVMALRGPPAGAHHRRLAWAAPLALVPLWLGARWLALGFLNQPPGFLENPLVGAGLAARLWTAGDCYLRALELLVAPFRLIADYSYATVPAVTAPTIRALAGLALLAATGAALLYARRRAPVVAAGLALWLVPYLLVSHLGPTVPMIFAERFLYLPSAGACLLAGLAIGRLATAAAGAPARAAAAAALALPCLLFSVRAADRVADWRDDRTLFLRTAEDAPSGVKPLCNAATILAETGDLPAALDTVERALAIAGDQALPQLTAAVLYTNAGDPAPAADHLARAAALRPDAAKLAAARCAYAARFGAADAVSACRAATALPLAGPDAWVLLGIAADQAGDPGAAEAAFRRALALARRPGVSALYNYGVFLARQRRFAEARRLLEAAAREAPDHAGVARALAGVRRAAEVP